MIAATISAAMPSARLKPVSRITTPGDGGGDERGQVGDDVLVGALDVERLRRLARASVQRRREVDDDADQRDDEHRGTLDVGRVDDSPDALEDDQHAEHEQRRAVELRGEDLGALEPEGHRAPRPAGRASLMATSDSADRAGVGEHVRGVGEQRQRVTAMPTTTSTAMKPGSAPSAIASLPRSASRETPCE